MAMTSVPHDMGATPEPHQNEEQGCPEEQLEGCGHRYLRIFSLIGICCIIPCGLSRVSAFCFCSVDNPA